MRLHSRYTTVCNPIANGMTPLFSKNVQRNLVPQILTVQTVLKIMKHSQRGLRETTLQSAVGNKFNNAQQSNRPEHSKRKLFPKKALT